MKVIDSIKNQIPFELKRGSSFLSVVIALIIAGVLTRLGEMILEGLLDLIRPSLPDVWNWFISIITFSFELNLIGLVIFAISLFPIYRYFDKSFLKRIKGEIVFIDRFNAGNRGWRLNYWGSRNPQKTNRIENSFMVFEATESDSVKGEFGACFDLRNGIYQGNKYEVTCKVKSDENTTMQFRLWLHDTTGGDSSIRTNFKTPSTKLEEFKLGFTANETEAIRIHLHNKAGVGRIIVDEVVVRKI
jgi:hypothetical protein